MLSPRASNPSALVRRTGTSASTYTSFSRTASYAGQTPDASGVATILRRRAVAAAFAAAADPPSLVSGLWEHCPEL